MTHQTFTEPSIKISNQKKLVGMRMQMSLAQNQTGKLWATFMPKRGQILNKISADLISMQVYNEPMDLGNLNQEFEKWAAVEVSSFNEVSSEFETFTLEEGLYAVFNYKGFNTDPSIFIYIFGTWLPQSNYVLDQRPQFEILGSKYKNGDPNSEEEIWIPIKNKV